MYHPGKSKPATPFYLYSYPFRVDYSHFPVSTIHLYYFKYIFTGMFISSYLKHLIHCIALFTFCYAMVSCLVPFIDAENRKLKPWATHGAFVSVLILYILRIPILLAFPTNFFSAIGLLFFNAFPKPVTLKGSAILKPLICFRVVTRGDFPQLIRQNVSENLSKCFEVGIENFIIEVIIERTMNLEQRSQIREVILPASYRPRGGAMYKARALQYCLESYINILSDNDYIVHLDEETVMSSDSIRGIMNFVQENKYDFGQGMITYGSGPVVNWFTTLADSLRTGQDMGQLRAQFYMFHKPVFSWKGSYMVARVSRQLLREANRCSTFDQKILLRKLLNTSIIKSNL